MALYELILVIIALVLLITLTMTKVPLWLSLTLIALMLSLLKVGINDFINILIKTLHDKVTINLMILTFTIALFINIYNRVGYVSRLSNGLIRTIRNPKLILALLPALLGLLPVAGGALMSAPIVDEIGNKVNLSKHKRLFINVWFRHTILLAYPLSTVIITASALSGVDLWMFVLSELPIVLIMILIGYLIALRSVKGSVDISINEGKSGLTTPLLPIVLAILTALALAPLIDRREELPLITPSILIGVIVAIAVTLANSGSPLTHLVSALKTRNVWELVITSYAAMLLKYVFTLIDLPHIIVSTLHTKSLVLMSFIIPLVLGFTLGSFIGSVIISISIVTSIPHFSPYTVILAYTSAFLGYLVSPLHLCYIYTAQYLKTSIIKGYKYMMPSMIITAILSYVVLTIP